jgi:hypothetical protein
MEVEAMHGAHGEQHPARGPGTERPPKRVESAAIGPAAPGVTQRWEPKQ